MSPEMCDCLPYAATDMWSLGCDVRAVDAQPALGGAMGARGGAGGLPGLMRLINGVDHRAAAGALPDGEGSTSNPTSHRSSRPLTSHLAPAGLCAAVAALLAKRRPTARSLLQWPVVMAAARRIRPPPLCTRSRAGRGSSRLRYSLAAAAIAVAPAALLRNRQQRRMATTRRSGPAPPEPTSGRAGRCNGPRRHSSWPSRRWG